MFRKGKPNPAHGRPKNRPNKVTTETVRRALETGPLPAEQLLTLARTAVGMASKFQPRFTGAEGEVEAFALSPLNAEFKEWMRLSIEASKAAAPYFNYRLTALKLEGGVPDLSVMSDDELNAIERTARLIAEHRRDRGGTVPPLH
jgi:hypothetical protein